MQNKTFELIEKMYSEFSNRFERLEDEFTSRFESLEKEMENLNNKVDRNTLLLEKTNADIKIIAEVQENHINQNIKQHEEIINKLGSDIEIMKVTIQDISKDMKFIEHKEFQNEKAIFSLKDELKVIK